MDTGVFQFGDCLLDRDARELRRGGELLVLPPKVFDCLVYLIAHRDRAIGRDELIAAVWGRADVSDTLLGQTVLKARRAVGDTGNDQNAIRTVPRFGYRWVAEVQAVAAAPQAAPAAPESSQEYPPHEAEPNAAAPGDSAPSPPRRPWRWGVAAVLLAIAGLALVWTQREHGGPAHEAAAPAPATPANELVAVLPAQTEADPDGAWLRLGLMDLVASRLRSAGMAVVPSDNVVHLARSDMPAGEAAWAVRRASGAARLVLPRVARSGDGWTVRLTLEDTGGPALDVQAEATEAAAAGREAADRLLGRLGKAAATGAAELSASEILQRAEAALLTDDLDQARRLLESAPPDLRDAPALRLRLAQIDFRAGRLAEATQRLLPLLAQTPAEVDPVLRARILIAIGAVAVRQDEPGRALTAYDEAVRLLEVRREAAALGQAYTGRAAALAESQRLDEASADFSRARIALELSGDTLALARVEANEGVLDNLRNRHAEALPILERSARRFEQFGALNELSSVLSNQIDALLALLRPAEALAVSDRAWSLLGRLENPLARRSMRLQRARTLTAIGRLTEARALLDGILRDPDLHQEASMPGRTLLAAAVLDAAEDRPAAAGASARRAATDEAPVTYDRERAQAWLIWTRALRAERRSADAAAQTDAFAEWAARSGNPAVLALARLAQAERNADQAGDEGRTRAAFDQVLVDADRLGVPMLVAEAVTAYGDYLIGHRDLERASAVVGQVARWADSDYGCAVLLVRLYHALGQHDAWQGALARARSLSGERTLPDGLNAPPGAGMADMGTKPFH
ncbi:MAG TPA: winged helix-turn-helix domain-containing protein [Dokdonella sp.]|uniref:winged helix-turn-helix domain-containing protein n=1 Tax=Dokdonella sp. TaxID=2291710 RepID=UPI002D0FE08B|nr:winged helix-turn-helix domain-containing protein [Dokdonella sp.]HUD42434.1 winged helix-turn-helix domain-containing protein [Dokdonella sp.]